MHPNFVLYQLPDFANLTFLQFFAKFKRFINFIGQTAESIKTKGITMYNAAFIVPTYILEFLGDLDFPAILGM